MTTDDAFLELFGSVERREFADTPRIVVSSAALDGEPLDCTVALVGGRLDLGIVCVRCMANFSGHVEGGEDSQPMMAEVRAAYNEHMRTVHGQ